jgi:hypothetical protein
VTRLRCGRSPTLWFECGQRKEIFLFFKPSRPALCPTQPPIYLIAGVYSPRANRQWSESNHSPPSMDESKNPWSYTSSPPYVCIAWCLIRHRGSLTCTVHQLLYFPNMSRRPTPFTGFGGIQKEICETFWILESWEWDRQVVPRSAIRIYHYSLRNSPEERSSR